LHIIDIAPFDGSDPIDSAIKIVSELKKYSGELYEKNRWLVFNKTDLLSAEEIEQRSKNIIDALNWTGPVYTISALSQTGTKALSNEIMTYLDQSHGGSTQYR